MLIAAGLSLLYIFLGVVLSNFCRNIPGVRLETLSSVFVSNSIVSTIQYIVGRLHTDKFPQSVVILRGRL